MPYFTTGNPEAAGPRAILKPGVYSFVVVDATEETAKSGNPMIEVRLKVGDEGVTVFDRLVFVPSAFWKLDHFLRSAGIHPGEGRTIHLAAESCVGIKGRCRIKTGKTDKGEDRNEVDDFVWNQL